MPDAPRPVRVMTPYEPPALTPGAAFALLRLLRAGAGQWVDGPEGVVRIEFGDVGCDEEQWKAA